LVVHPNTKQSVSSFLNWLAGGLWQACSRPRIMAISSTGWPSWAGFIMLQQALRGEIFLDGDQHFMLELSVLLG